MRTHPRGPSRAMISAQISCEAARPAKNTAIVACASVTSMPNQACRLGTAGR